MSVYKEAFFALAAIEKASVQIWPDSADYGAPAKKGDAIWMQAKQLASYANAKDRDVIRYASGKARVTTKVTVMDEWDTGEKFTVEVAYEAITNGEFDGYVTVDLISGNGRNFKSLVNSFNR